jgi:hypothetical protein
MGGGIPDFVGHRMTQTTNTLSAADRAEALDLFARYAWSLDTNDPDSFVECFAPNGTIVMPKDGTFTGPDELRTYHQIVTGQELFPGRQHFISQSIIRGTSERATAKSYCQITYRDPQGKSIIQGLGYYQDELVRNGQQWQFARREFFRWGGEVLARFPQVKKD